MKNSNAIPTRRSILGLFGTGGLITMQAGANRDCADHGDAARARIEPIQG